MNPTIDGRLALRIREIAAMEADTVSGDVITSAQEKARILNVAADVFEEYVMAQLAKEAERG